jgi:iron(III) transport system substrate-binding protein
MKKNTINILSLIFITFFSINLFAKEINIYSHRQPFLINPFLEIFTNETGIKTNVIYSKKGLAQRLQSEGENSPADVILTVDIGRLYIYSDLNLLLSIDSKLLTKNVPSHLRSPENNWFALSKRARVIAVNKDIIEDGEITRLEDLANPKWKGQICSRPGSHVYNRGIMASVLAEYGEENAEAWAKGLVNKTSRK